MLGSRLYSVCFNTLWSVEHSSRCIDWFINHFKKNISKNTWYHFAGDVYRTMDNFFILLSYPDGLSFCNPLFFSLKDLYKWKNK